ncbi:MAG: hypothetical protein ACK5L5_03865 [Bacteroidales bacterium]
MVQKIINRLLLGILPFLAFPTTTKADGITVGWSMQDSMLIGDQIELNIIGRYTGDGKNMVLDFPVFTDTIVKNIRVLKTGVFDTTKVGDTTSVAMKTLITSFELGTYDFGEIHMGAGFGSMLDTMLLNNIKLTVFYPDSIHMDKAPAPIDSIIEAPVTFKEIAPWLFGVLLAILIIALIILLVYKYINRKKANEVVQKEAAYIVALRELNKVKEGEEWKSLDTKTYFSRVSDIVRVYIEGQFGIKALESTTREIIQEFKSNKNTVVTATQLSHLKEVLSDADLVKFAKHFPDESEHVQLFNKALWFVKETMVNDMENNDAEMKDPSKSAQPQNSDLAPKEDKSVENK